VPVGIGKESVIRMGRWCLEQQEDGAAGLQARVINDAPSHIFSSRGPEPEQEEEGAETHGTFPYTAPWGRKEGGNIKK
jgi:hypothetical protein